MLLNWDVFVGWFCLGEALRWIWPLFANRNCPTLLEQMPPRWFLLMGLSMAAKEMNVFDPEQNRIQSMMTGGRSQYRTLLRHKICSSSFRWMGISHDCSIEFSFMKIRKRICLHNEVKNGECRFIPLLMPKLMMGKCCFFHVGTGAYLPHQKVKNFHHNFGGTRTMRVILQN